LRTPEFANPLLFYQSSIPDQNFVAYCFGIPAR